MPRAIEPAKIPVPQTINRVHSSKKNKLNTTYNQHAKNGFKYWYQEQNKPMDRKYLTPPPPPQALNVWPSYIKQVLSEKKIRELVE